MFSEKLNYKVFETIHVSAEHFDVNTMKLFQTVVFLSYNWGALKHQIQVLTRTVGRHAAFGLADIVNTEVNQASCGRSHAFIRCPVTVMKERRTSKWVTTNRQLVKQQKREAQA